MLNLSSITSADQKLIRTIQWESGGKRNVRLAVTLEYMTPDYLVEEQQKEKARVISARKLVPLEDVNEINNAITRVWHRLLAEAVQDVTLPGGKPVTIREMSGLMSLSPEQVRKSGGMDAAVPLNPKDQTPLTDEEKKLADPSSKTRGDQGQKNLLYLIRVCPGFSKFLGDVISDIGYFQDEDWESQLKNS
jgi:hypothetical protein